MASPLLLGPLCKQFCSNEWRQLHLWRPLSLERIGIHHACVSGMRTQPKLCWCVVMACGRRRERDPLAALIRSHVWQYHHLNLSLSLSYTHTHTYTRPLTHTHSLSLSPLRSLSFSSHTLSTHSLSKALP